jgi:hypothetical protein
MTYAVTSERNASGPATVAVPSRAAASDFRPPERVPAFVPRDQLYYWSYAWREAERKAMDDLRAGRTREFDDPMAAVRYLLGSDR